MRYMSLSLTEPLTELRLITTAGGYAQNGRRLRAPETVRGIELESGRLTTIKLTQDAQHLLAEHLTSRKHLPIAKDILNFLVDDIEHVGEAVVPAIEARLFIGRALTTVKINLDGFPQLLPANDFGDRFELVGKLMGGASSGKVVRISVSDDALNRQQTPSALLVADGIIVLNDGGQKNDRAFVQGEPLAIEKCLPLRDTSFFSAGAVKALPFRATAAVVPPWEEIGDAGVLFGLSACAITVRFTNGPFKGLNAVISPKNASPRQPKPGESVTLELERRLNSNKIAVRALGYN